MSVRVHAKIGVHSRLKKLKKLIFAAGATAVVGVGLLVAVSLWSGLHVFAGIWNLLLPHPDAVENNPRLTIEQNHKVLWRGSIANYEIDESSALTASPTHEGILWTLNDSGGTPTLYAVGTDGASHGEYSYSDAPAFDWESLDAFTEEGQPLLLVGDVGDNLRWRRYVTLYVLHEPEDLNKPEEPLLLKRSIDVVYPHGPRDCEAIAVDGKRNRILMLSKRQSPPELYAIPLQSEGQVEAQPVASLLGMPKPTEADYQRASDLAPYLYMPTGMDVNGDRLLVTTYQHMFLFDLNALEEPPVKIPLPIVGQREAVTFDQSGTVVFTTSERIDPTYSAELFSITVSD